LVVALEVAVAVVEAVVVDEEDHQEAVVAVEVAVVDGIKDTVADGIKDMVVDGSRDMVVDMMAMVIQATIVPMAVVRVVDMVAKADMGVATHREDMVLVVVATEEVVAVELPAVGEDEEVIKPRSLYTSSHLP